MLFSLIISFIFCICKLVYARSLIDTTEVNQYNPSLEFPNTNHSSGLSKPSTENTLVVLLQFEHFDLYNSLESNNLREFPFLSHFFYEEQYNIFTPNNTKQKEDYSNTLDVKELPDKINLKNHKLFQHKDDVLLIRFLGENYDIAKLDKFLIECFTQLKDINPGSYTFLFQFENRADIEAFTRNEPGTEYVSKKTENIKIHSIDDSANEKQNSNFTEGLLSCLIVSGLLLGIFLTGVYCLMSLDISYGALQKSTNPLKKIN